MKILFCTQCELSRELGAAKVAIELSEAMSQIGWQCELRAIPQIHAAYCSSGAPSLSAPEAFRRFVREHASAYDVIDFDYAYLPYPRTEFSPTTLLVARSVLLVQHLANIRLRTPDSLAFKTRSWVRERLLRTDKQLKDRIRSGSESIRGADLVNVGNHADRELLEANGVPREKIVVLPYGISWGSWTRSKIVERAPAVSAPTLAFVGTFDYRKGCLDLVDIARTVFSKVPECRLRLLGTRGMILTESKVRSFFPRDCHDRLEIVPRYASEELPQLLSGASLGIFPSYLEGFGIGVVEMVASGIPVLAYAAPGPCDILPAECLAPIGQWRTIAEQAIRLLQDDESRSALAQRCRERCEPFDWSKIALATSTVYRETLERIRERPSIPQSTSLAPRVRLTPSTQNS